MIKSKGWFFGSIFVVIIGILWYYYMSFSIPENIQSRMIEIRTLNVDNETILSSKMLHKLIKKIVNENEPILIKPGLCSNWMHLFEDIFVLKDQFRHIYNVKSQHGNPNFVYYDYSSPEQFLLSPMTKPIFNLSERMRFDQFIKKGFNESNDLYLYYSDILKNKNILKQLSKPKLKGFNVEFDHIGNIIKSKKKPETNLWIGFENATATIHYDANINFFQQFYGTKKFILMSPEYWHQLKVYPRIHPSDRQSQIIDIKQFIRDNGVKYYEFNVHKGDMLYIPPFWFHYVKTITNYSISLNMWSSSHELILFQNQILTNALKYAKELSLKRHDLMHTFTYFFPKLVNTIITNQYNFTPKELLCNIVLINSYQTMIKNDISLKWMNDPNINIKCNYNITSEIESEILNEITNINKVFNRIDKHIKPTLLVNYIDSILGYVIESQKIIPFIHQCLCSSKNLFWISV